MLSYRTGKLLFSISVALLVAPALCAFPSCDESTVIGSSCSWATRQMVPAGPIILKGQWPSMSRGFPVLLMANNQSSGAAPVSGFSLVLRRLVLANVDLAAPDAAGVPELWPLGMFAAPGTNLSMADVRLVVGDDIFQQYVSFFKSSAASWQHHTDGRSFLHLASWTSNMTTLHSVTLVSGPCRPASAEAYTNPSASLAAAAAASKGGCAVRAVDNTTLIPTLLQDAALCTPQPLLVIITANVTLGPGLAAGALTICRPVIMVGLFTRPTSVDFGMVVNQLNVTAAHAAMYWQSLVLENAAPGDAISSIMAPPYSGAISSNIWAVYCNRSALCLRLFNTTTVLASQDEMNYVTFMFSSFNSPLPSMQAATDFYHTELKVKTLQFVPGPGDHAILIRNLTSSAYDIVGAIYTTQPVVAVRLPLPPGPAVDLQATRAGPLVQAVSSCNSMQSAMQRTTQGDRLHVMLLLSNVSIHPADDPNCWQHRSIDYPTHIYAQQVREDASLVNSPLQPPLDPALPAVVPDTARSAGSKEAGRNFYSLSFNYTQSALELPPAADDKYLHLQNITLLQLPQGPEAHKAVGYPILPDVLTILLWNINRTMQDSPVYINDLQLLLPQQEYDFVADSARAAGSFVVQLAGTTGLTFVGAVVGPDSVHVSSLQGPGIVGSNIWLLPDPAAAQAMPGGYVWPLAAVEASTKSGLGSNGRQATVQAAVGAAVGSLGLLLLLLCLWCWCRIQRRSGHRLKQQQQQPGLKNTCSDKGVIQWGSRGVGPGSVAGKQHGHQEAAGARQSVRQQRDQDCTLCIEELAASAPLAAAGQPGRVRDCSSVAEGGSARCSMQGELHSSSSTVQAQHAHEQQLKAAATTAPQSDVSPAAAAAAAAAAKHGMAAGLRSWKTAINNTTLQLMERRMQSLHSTPRPNSSFGSRAGSAHTSSTDLNGAAAVPASQGSSGASLQLQALLGQGSFGCVYLGTWHGKRVAVKVMQLPATALLGPPPPHQQQNSPPHMAIMETVVSSTMSHPNVVQVYTYMINPLTVEGAADAAGAAAAREQQQQLSGSCQGAISGWQLKLVMEYCDQGTLREALDRRTLLRGSGASLLAPALVLSLAHDVAAALLHLHSEGVVHGDLKAANVMLTKGGEDPGGVWAATVGYCVTAKVADFGLALPLDPKDTHATMAARGTPTHMSPELFMAGHVSKASDVYAYGILLYELMTGQRAYAGVPIPLLPHEVARQGLRPTWPPNLPPGCRDLQELAEACWAQQPQDRPSFQDIFNFLEACRCEHLAAFFAGEQPPLTLQQSTLLGRQHQPLQQEQQGCVGERIDTPVQQLQLNQPQGAELQPRLQGMDWSEVTAHVVEKNGNTVCT